MPTEATPEEQKAVTTAQMEEFLASQFDAQAGVPATVTRVTDGVAEPTYAFDVVTGGGSGVRGWPHKVKIFFGAVNISDEAPLGMAQWHEPLAMHHLNEWLHHTHAHTPSRGLICWGGDLAQQARACRG